MVKYQRIDRVERQPRDRMWVASKWGRQDITVLTAAASGSGTGRLIVFRLGTAPADRFWAHIYGTLVYREMWWIVAVGCLMIALCTLPREDKWLWAPAVATGITVALIATAYFLGRRALAEARGIKISIPKGYRRGDDSMIDRDSAMAEQLCRRLCEMDRQRLDPPLYETRWAEVYEELGQITGTTDAGL